MEWLYSAFGLVLRADRPLPGLIRLPAARTVDLDIRLDPSLWAEAINGRSRELRHVRDGDAGEPPALHIWSLDGGEQLQFVYRDGTEFLLDRAGTELRAKWTFPSTLEDTATYLLGPVIGMALRLRGIACLHASAVAFGKRAVAFMGPPGAGKSTVAAAFSGMGHPVLADDIVALVCRDSRLCVQPAYPQLRLWPDSVALLYGTPDALPRLTPGWDKRALDLTRAGCHFHDQPLPLEAVYVLPGGWSHVPGRIEGLEGREAFLALLANTYVDYRLDTALLSGEFETLSHVAATVPVRLVPALDGTAVPQLCDRILEDCEALRCTVSPTTAR